MDKNEGKPDLLEYAGQLRLLKAFIGGGEIMQVSIGALSSGEYDDEFADSRAVIVASAVLAVAGELRNIHNMLVDVRDANRAIGGSLAALVAELQVGDGVL